MKKSKIALITLMILVCCTVTAFADVFTSGEAFITDAKAFMVRISTLVAVIGIAFGAIKCKTAGGNPQKIEVGFNAIKWSIGGWILVNGAPLIFSTITTYL